MKRENEYIERQIWHEKNGKDHDKISISTDKYRKTKMENFATKLVYLERQI